jgi:hypothetical protein
VLVVLVLAGCGSNSPTVAEAGQVCFSCQSYWICGGDVSEIDLKPEADGCYLSGLPGRNLLAPDGTITADGTVVGKATGTGARVQVNRPDGSQWLFCTGAGGC